MFCEICDSEAINFVYRYQNEPYIDGKIHNEICRLCSTMAEKYHNSSSDYGILTGYIASKEFVMSRGFSEIEYDKVFKILKRLVVPIKIENNIIFSVLHFGPIRFLDIGPIVLNIDNI